MRDRIGSKRRVLLAATGLLSGAIATHAFADLPITLGPGSPNATLGSRHDPVIDRPAEAVSATGVALADYALGTLSGEQARTVFLTPGASFSALTTISGGDGPADQDVISSDGYIAGRVDVTSDGTATGTSLGTRPVRYAPGSTTATALELPVFSLNASSNGIVGVNWIATGGAAAGGSSSYSGNTYLGVRGVVWNAGSTTPSTRFPLTYNANNFGNSNVNVINDGGVAGGYSEHYDNSGHDLGQRPTRWAPNTGIGSELIVPSADANGIATGYISAMNNSGTAWGVVRQYDAGGTFLGIRPARWDAGTTAITPLGISGTDINGKAASASVSAVNDAGTAVGYVNAYTPGFAALGVRAVRWNASTTASSLLGTLFTGTVTNSTQIVTMANSLNALGTTTGYSLTADGSAKHAVLWLPGSTTPLDLNTLITTGGSGIQSLDEADGISTTGWVTGIATYASTKYQRAFTMLVPQAGTYGLGDANFDTHVDFADLLVLAKNYGKASNGSTNVADFDLNGTTDFNDLLTLAKHYGAASAADIASATGDAAFASDWAIAQSLVPEPGLAAGLTLLTFARPRRRMRR